MTDQAFTLRRLAAVTQPAAAEGHPDGPGTRCLPHRVKAISFTSGKGGVGKTHIVVNLAYAIQRRGIQVLVIDADLGLANVDVLLGLTPQFNIQHVLMRQKSIADVLVQGPAGMTILPASSGVPELIHLTGQQHLQLLSQLSALDDDIAVVLIDTGAGISTNVMYFNTAAHEIVVVVTPEPTSITDAYALIKLLATQHAKKRFRVLLNTVANEAEGKEIFRCLKMVTERFLDVSVTYLGSIVYDASFSQAVRQQKPLLELYPHSIAAQCFHQLASRLLAIPDRLPPRD